jgi:hypothetical protein
MTPERCVTPDVLGAVYLLVMKRSAVLLALLLVAVTAGCGSSTKVSVSGGVIHINRGVQTSSLAKSVLGITKGTGAAVVHSRFGRPANVNRAHGLTCSWYRAEQKDSSIDGLGFCFGPKQRVERIMFSVHL